MAFDGPDSPERLRAGTRSPSPDDSIRGELVAWSCLPSVWASPAGMAQAERLRPMLSPYFAELAPLPTKFQARGPVETLPLVVSFPLVCRFRVFCVLGVLVVGVVSGRI